MPSDIGTSAPLVLFRHANGLVSARLAGWGLASDRSGFGVRWRTVVGRLFCILAGLLVPLLLAELFFRVGGAVAPGDYQTTELTAASDLFERQNLANRAGWKRSSEFETYVRINSHGLRGPEVPYEKPADTFRVLVVGDSFTFGAQVNEEQTFVSRLQGYLRDRVHRAGMDQSKIETINGGVDGWSTINELAWLKAEGVRYDPDLVLLMFYTGNDPGENFDRLKAVKRATGGLEDDTSTWLRDLRRTLAQSSALYSVFETGVIAKLTPQADTGDQLDPSVIQKRRSMDPDRKARGWEMSGSLIKQMREHCADRRIGLVVVGIPTLELVENPDRDLTPIVAIGQQAGAPVFELAEPFRAAAASSTEDLYYPKDRHWTALGHDLAADVVASALVNGGFIVPRAAAP